MFKTSSSNFQLSDITLSLLKDNGSLTGFNTNQMPPGVMTKNFMETDAFEIKEEEEEYCCTPLNQFY
jgi:hypothetical protein